MNQFGYAAGLQSEPDGVNRSYDLFSPGYAADLSIAADGNQRGISPAGYGPRKRPKGMLAPFGNPI